MAYQLLRPDSGRVTLRSGTWHWFVVRIVSMPDDECVLQRLVYVHADEPDATMSVTIDPLDSVETSEDAAAQAERVTERTIRTAEGWFAVYPPLANASYDDWIVKPQGARRLLAAAGADGHLSSLTTSELVDVLRRARPVNPV